MLETKDIEIEGHRFQLRPLPVLKAARLDKKVITVLAPILGTVKSLDDEINIEKAVKSVMDALSSLSDAEYEAFIIDLCSTVVYTAPGQQPIELGSSDINKIFVGELKTLYKLMFEVMRYNKFSPFGLVEGGNVTSIMSFLGEQKEKETTSGKESETLES